MLRFVFVRFAPTHVTSDGQEVSTQPSMWYRILHHGNPAHTLDTTGIRNRIKNCWLPKEYHCSLNLVIDLDDDRPHVNADELNYLLSAFPGAIQIGLPDDSQVWEPDGSAIPHLTPEVSAPTATQTRPNIRLVHSAA